MGFATATPRSGINPENVAGKVDVEMLLASRQQEQSDVAAACIDPRRGRVFQALPLDNALSFFGRRRDQCRRKYMRVLETLGRCR